MPTPSTPPAAATPSNPICETNSAAPHAEITGILETIAAREALPEAVRESLSNRARNAFDAYYQRPVGKRNDDARLLVIELALIALYPKQLMQGVGGPR